MAPAPGRVCGHSCGSGRSREPLRGDGFGWKGVTAYRPPRQMSSAAVHADRAVTSETPCGVGARTSAPTPELPCTPKAPATGTPAVCLGGSRYRTQAAPTAQAMQGSVLWVEPKGPSERGAWTAELGGGGWAHGPCRRHSGTNGTPAHGSSPGGRDG